jgi:hypothetical protein
MHIVEDHPTLPHGALSTLSRTARSCRSSNGALHTEHTAVAHHSDHGVITVAPRCHHGVTTATHRSNTLQ